MMTLVMLAVSVRLQTQDDPERKLLELIEMLRSDKIEERQEASEKLKGLGKSAILALEKASRDGDRELSSRAQLILRALTIKEHLTTNLLEVMPGLEDRLANGGDHAWTLAFLDALKGTGKAVDGNRAVLRDDLEALFIQAARGARTSEERGKICNAVEMWRFSSGSQEVLPFVGDKDPRVRSQVCDLLVNLPPTNLTSRLQEMLHSADPASRAGSAETLGKLCIQQAAPNIRRLLGDPDQSVRLRSIEALGKLRAWDSRQDLLLLLKNDSARIREAASTALGLLGAHEAISELLRLMGDGDTGVRRSTALALEKLIDRDHLNEVRPLLADKDPYVRASVASRFVRCGNIEAVATLLESVEREWSNPELLDGLSLSALNAIRQAEVWKKLGETAVPKTLDGTLEEILSTISREVGLAIATPNDHNSPRVLKTVVKVPLENRGQRPSMLEALGELLEWGPFEFILERDRIRVVRRQDALTFWKDWYEVKQEKK